MASMNVSFAEPRKTLMALFYTLSIFSRFDCGSVVRHGP